MIGDKRQRCEVLTSMSHLISDLRLGPQQTTDRQTDRNFKELGALATGGDGAIVGLKCQGK